jgi:hypothetical protein
MAYDDNYNFCGVTETAHDDVSSEETHNDDEIVSEGLEIGEETAVFQKHD